MLPFGKPRHRRSGQIAIMAVLSLTLTFAVIGLSVDLGYGYLMKQQAQTAADAAASAAAVYAMNHADSCGGSGLSCPVTYNCADPATTPATTSLQAGCLYAQQNGFVNDGARQTVSLKESNTAPPNLSGNSPAIWIQATVTQNLNNSFLVMHGFKTGSASASAIAGVTTTPSTNCIYALSSGGVSITDSGSGNITTSCGISDNGGLSYSGSGNITASCASGGPCPIQVNGNFTDSGAGNISSTTAIHYGGTYSNTGSGSVSPAATSGTATITDPFAGLSPPSVGACTYTNESISDSSAHTLSPGVYCGGLSISGSGNITFNTGTYILNGGQGSSSFSYSGSGNLSGSGVTFFITGKSGYSAYPISISGSGNLTFSAPSSGSYTGLLFYQDPSVSYAGSNSCSGSGNVTGTFYFPTTTLSYSGSGNALMQALVANTIVFSGSGNFTKDTTGQYTGLTKSTASLIQ